MSTDHNTNLPLRRERSSNLELYRVIVMLLIVAHHYVVNSGVAQLAYQTPTQPHCVFMLLFGAWGKVGINCFVLISGYFMCESQITLKKFLKLLLEVLFYRIVLYMVFLLTGYTPFSVKDFVKLFLPVTSVGTNFTGCYLVFFLCIPFLNILIRNLNEKNHLRLLALTLGVYTVLGTLPTFDVTMNYVTWFIVLYFVASYLRRYPKKLFDKGKFWGWLSLGLLAVSAASVVVCGWLGGKTGKPGLAYYFVADSNRVLAVALAVSTFLFFRNWKLPTSRLINTMGASTFGVLLIHAGSETMRRWLWQDLLGNSRVFGTAWMVPHALLSVLGIFAVCCVIDVLRIRLLETPFFRWWDRRESGLVTRWRNTEVAICKKFGISE